MQRYDGICCLLFLALKQHYSQVQDARDLIRIKAEAAASAERCCSDLRFELEENRATHAAMEAASTSAANAAMAEVQAELANVKQQLQVQNVDVIFRESNLCASRICKKIENPLSFFIMASSMQLWRRSRNELLPLTRRPP